MIIDSHEDMIGREAEIALRSYTGHTDRSAGRAIELTLRTLIRMNVETVGETKADLPMWGGVLLKRESEGGKSAKVPVSFTAVFGDHDSGTVPVAAAARMLEAAGICAAVMETASSTPQHPRWRVVAPMAGPLPAAAYREQVSKLNTALEGSLAAESWSTKQGYYYGHVRGSKPPEGVMVVGATLDLLALLPTPCLISPIRSLGDTAAGSRAVIHEFDLVGAEGGEIEGTERPSHERVATSALTTGDNLHSGVLAATHLVANGQWPEAFTYQAFLVAATSTRGVSRTQNFRYEWEQALAGAVRYQKERSKQAAPPTTSGLLIPFKFAPGLIVPPTSIQGFLPAEGVGVMWGEPSSFKSFVALDMALSIVWGLDWHGRRTKPGRVWYLAGEGQSGIERRIRAWSVEHGKIDATGQPQDLGDRFHLTPRSVLVNSPDGGDSPHMLELAGLIRAGKAPSHIFVDTIARTMVGDENTSKDMGAYIRGLDLLVEAARESGLPVCVVAVHHSKKDGATYRGSSALRGAADFEFEISREGMVVTATCHKMKDFAEPEPERFLAAEVPLGTSVDEWGTSREVCSLVLRQDDLAMQADGASLLEKQFEPIRAAILDGHGSSANSIQKVLGEKSTRGFTATVARLLELGWLQAPEPIRGRPRPLMIGPRAPIEM